MKLFNEKTYEALEKRVSKPVTEKDTEDVVETLRALNKEDAMFKYLRSIKRSIDIFSMLANDESQGKYRRIFVGSYNLMASSSGPPDTNICEDNYKVFAKYLVENGFTSQKIVDTVEAELNRFFSWDKQPI
jgi:hypothetical protein